MPRTSTLLWRVLHEYRRAADILYSTFFLTMYCFAFDILVHQILHYLLPLVFPLHCTTVMLCVEAGILLIVL